MWLCITLASKGHFESWSESLEQRHGGSLIIEKEISWDKPTCLSNRESPLPSVFSFFCLMQHQPYNRKSENCCQRWVISRVEPRQQMVLKQCLVWTFLLFYNINFFNVSRMSNFNFRNIHKCDY